MTSENGMWSGRRVLVTGGTSFIGSNLVDQLVNRGARVRMVDDLTSGRLENVQGHLASGAAEHGARRNCAGFWVMVTRCGRPL